MIILKNVIDQALIKTIVDVVIINMFLLQSPKRLTVNPIITYCASPYGLYSLYTYLDRWTGRQVDRLTGRQKVTYR